MKIACVLGPGFEDLEFKDPYDALRNAGHEVTIVGLEAGAVLAGSKGTVSATVDKAFKDVKPEQFDALLIPGGGSPDKLRAHDEAVKFVKAFMTAGKPTFAICHGPQLLLTANEYKDRRMTAWKTVLGDLGPHLAGGPSRVGGPAERGVDRERAIHRRVAERRGTVLRQ